MIAEISRYFAALLILAGAIFSLLAAVGVLRLPDLYTRLHAASKAGVVGAGLILCAVAIVSGDGPTMLRAALGIVFLLLSTPVAAHLLARSALKAGEAPAARTIIEDID